MLKQQIEQDLKAALLGGEKTRTTVLRGVKSAILYAELAKGARTTGLSEEEITVILAKEAKKRQESADLYVQGGDKDRAKAELAEKEIIESYLPKQLTDDELKQIVEEIVQEIESPSMQAMGQVVGAVKNKVGAAADGARIARIAKERLSQ